MPPQEIRRLRTRTRYRRHLTQARTAGMERCEKPPEDAHPKPSSVISNIHGVSGRDMLTAIIAGERTPKVPAQMARTRMRGKITQLEQALDCSFLTGQHALIVQMMPADIDHRTAQISELPAKTAVPCQPYLHQIAQPGAAPGTGILTAQHVIAATGTGMTVFPAAGHLCSRARRCPQVTSPAGNRTGSSATGRGNPYPGAAPGEAAVNAGRTQTFPGAKYRRLARPIPKNKAQAAISRSLPVICHALLPDPGAACTGPGTGHHQQRMNTRRQARSHARAPERPGCTATLQAIDPGTGGLLPIAS